MNSTSPETGLGPRASGTPGGGGGRPRLLNEESTRQYPVLKHRTRGELLLRYAPLRLTCQPQEHAAELRFLVGVAPDEVFDVSALIAAQGWPVRRARMLDRHGHGREAGIMPSDRYDFVLCVDPDWADGERWEDPFHRVVMDRETPVERFRLAHEIGHSFFYRVKDVSGNAPTRSGPPSTTEERFCDRFADALLVPAETASLAARQGAAAVIELARAMAAPISSVIRSAETVPALGGSVRQSTDGTVVLGESVFRWLVPTGTQSGLIESALRETVQVFSDKHPARVPFLSLGVGTPAQSVLVPGTISWAAGNKHGYTSRHAYLGIDRGDASRAAVGPR
jgi:hypothetical protein